VLAELEPRERAVETSEEELAAKERKLRREGERQTKTAERLDRHAADLVERERALARLGQSLLARRDGDHGSEPKPEPEIAFTEGIEALGAAAKTIRKE
jgi:Skp family chaperone for outer membrane proteins